ncbi:MAG: hypothetical protein ACP5SJ_00250 [Candidatus Micrarchaeia archaeon]
MDITLYIFAVFAAIELLLSFYIFLSRSLLHAIILLALMFIATSLLYLLLSQPLLAVVQLLVLVGGISTYLLVGTASESFSHFKHTGIALMVILALAIFTVMAYPLLASAVVYSFLTLYPNTISFTMANQSEFLQTDLPIFYIAALLLFGIAIGAILLYKKLGEKGEKK